MSNAPDELGEKVYNTIIGLGHIDLVSLVADICQLRGWKATIEVGNPDIAGDVLTTQEFPFPQSVSIVCYEGVLTKEQLDDCFQTHETSPARDLAVVLREPPSETTIEFAESHDIALFDPVDITDELLRFSATDILSEYVDSFNTSGGSQASSMSGGESSKGGEFGTIPSNESSGQATATVLAVVEDVDVSPIVYDHLLDPERRGYLGSENPVQTVALWEVQNDGDETFEYGNDYITYLFDDGIKSKVSDHVIDGGSLDGVWEPAPGPDKIPEVEANTRVRWISLVEQSGQRKLNGAVLKGARGKHEDIRISISGRLTASTDVLPFDA